MVTVTNQTFADNFVPGVPPPLPYTATAVSLELNDVNNDDIIDANGDIVNGSAVQSVYNGDVVIINAISIVGATIYTADGSRYFTPTDDTVLVDSVIDDVNVVTTSTQLTLDALGPACLTKGALVETQFGEKRVEDISVGDLVLTKDRGFQPIRWIGHRTVDGQGDFAPICIAKGAFGNERALCVSPAHRMLIKGWRCELLFGESEVLCAAKHLVNSMDDVYRLPCDEVSYYHLTIDQHEIIFAEGAATESFFMGEEVLKSDRSTKP